MSRVDDIKERVETFNVDYVYREALQTYTEAEADMRYLLNRIAKLEAVVEVAHKCTSAVGFAHYPYNVHVDYKRYDNLCKALASLDNDEKETTHGD